MKKNIYTLCLLALFFVALGCDNRSNETVSETAVTFVLDATDPTVFEAIESDFRQNLNTFFTNTGVGNLDFYQRLTVRVCGVEETDQLSIQSRYIELTDRRVSRQEAQRLKNPRPLLELISTELTRYKQLSENMMTSSPIIDVILKAFREMNPEAARELIVVCSDGLEKSRYSNFYKSIPTTEEGVKTLISKIDAILLHEAIEQVTATDPEIVFVLKTTNDTKRNMELKKFYQEFCRQLGVNTVSFIDNLNNNPRLL